MKNYLIIGASSGIGKALAEILADGGQKVFGTYNRNPVSSSANGIEYHQLNVLDNEPDFGFLPEKLHGLVYCPGSINLKPFTRIKPEEFLEDYELQVAGAVRVIQILLPRLKAAGSSSVLLFSTVAAGTGFNFHTLVSASKGAIEGLTRALAAELAPGIRVNCIAPSLTDTPLAASLLSNEAKREANALRHPLKRLGKPEDIASMGGFLLSDKAGWVSGQVIHVDGGIGALR